MPKSPSFTWFSFVRKIFCDLRSRCRILLRWRYCTVAHRVCVRVSTSVRARACGACLRARACVCERACVTECECVCV